MFHCLLKTVLPGISKKVYDPQVENDIQLDHQSHSEWLLGLFHICSWVSHGLVIPCSNHLKSFLPLPPPTPKSNIQSVPLCLAQGS